MAACVDELEPVYREICAAVRGSRIVQADETPIVTVAAGSAACTAIRVIIP